MFLKLPVVKDVCVCMCVYIYNLLQTSTFLKCNENELLEKWNEETEPKMHKVQSHIFFIFPKT